MKYCGVVTDRSWFGGKNKALPSIKAYSIAHFGSNRIYSDEVPMADEVKIFELKHPGCAKGSRWVRPKG
jgi:hypothetical protein